MKQHSAEFKQQLIELGKQIDSIITYVENGQTITLHEELYAVTPMFESSILKSVMKQLDFECSIDIPKETIINYQLGVLVGGDYEYLDYGNYVVYSSEKQEDKDTYKITCFDKMLYSMKPYEEITGTYPMTIKSYLNSVAQKIGLTVKDTNFYNYSLQIQADLYKGLEYTYRDVLDEIAQATGSIIIINKDDQIEVIYPTNSGDTINEEYFKDVNVNFSEKYGPINTIVLSRAGESDNVYIRDEESIAQNGLCEVKIVDNQIMNFNDRSDYLQGLLNALGGTEYYINDFETVGLLYYDIGDYYNVQIGENTYKCLMLNSEINVTSGLKETIYTDLPEQSKTDYSKADKTDRKINQTYIIVDKQNQTIESVVNSVGQQNNKISQITQTVDEINSKISDIADITTYGESSYASVNLSGVNTSEPVMLKVHPTTTNISYLYPRYNLYPSNDLFMTTRTIRFTRTYQEDGETLTEDIDYILPDDLLFYDANTYDEFYLNYESQTCQVTKRCGYNADGTVYALAEEVINTYDYPIIELGEGDYTVSILNCQYGYIYVRLMAQNIYTTQFYTKAETNSKINQAVGSIDLSVNQKLTNYSTTNEMNSAINIKANQITSQVSETYTTKSDTTTLSSRISQTAKEISLTVNNRSTSSGITITTTKEDGTTDTVTGTITMTGLVKFTDLSTSGSTTINGSNITTGIIKSSNYVSGSAGTSINLNTGAIDTKNFKVDSSGNITANAGKIGGWNIDSVLLQKTIGQYSFEIRSDRPENQPAFLVYKNQGNNQGYKFYVRPDGYLYAINAYISGTITASNLSNNAVSGGTITGTTMTNSSYSASGVRFSPSTSTVSGFTTYNNQMVVHNNYGAMGLGVAYTQMGTTTNNLFIEDTTGDNWVTIQYQGGYTNGGWYSGSKEEFKKNFEMLDKEKALDIVLNTDIYKYNLKAEDDNHQKHLGFIIGNNYNYSKDIVAVDNNGNEFGVDNYSMTSACYGAIQKLYEELERLKEKVL